MRKVIFLAIPLLVLVVLGVAVLAGEASIPPAWRVELNKYIRHKGPLWFRTVTVRSVAQASRPGRFSQDMSYATFSDNVYRTDYSPGGGQGGIDIPFPPEEVWCVLLERDRSTADDLGERVTLEVVFVALHRDTWNLEWVVHEGVGDLSDQKLRESLAVIGCDLSLEQLGLDDRN